MVFWMAPLIHLAKTRTLKESDVWDCPSSLAINKIATLFYDAWQKELKNASSSKRNPELLRALFKGFSERFIIAGFFQVCFLCSQISQPFLVGELVQFVASGNGSLTQGLWLAFGLGAVSLFSSLSLSSALYNLRILGLSIRSGIMMAVYDQALMLTASSRFENTIGQTTNLMAIDSEKLFLGAQFIHFLWHGPVTVVIVMGLLIRDLGYIPALAGLAWNILLVPMQISFAESIGRIRRCMIKHTDERVKLTNEFLQAIRVIKLYAWESPIEDRVRAVRAKETALLLRYLNANGYLRELMFAVQPITALVMFTVAIYGLHRPVSVVQVFRVLAFLNITRFPLNLLAQAMKNSKDALVSLERLTRFMLLETTTALRPNLPHPEPLLCVEDATFSWHSDLPDDLHPATEQFSLKDIQLKVSSSELVAVVGAVGSGKSCLLSALLGEVPLRGAGQRGLLHPVTVDTEPLPALQRAVRTGRPAATVITAWKHT